MSTQPDTLHDRITALATYRVHHANMGLCPEGPDDPSRDPDCEVCGWLAETPQPEADERAPMDVFQFAARRSQADAALAAAQPVEPEANEQAAHDRITALVDLHDRLVREDPVEPEATHTVTAEQVARLMEELAALDTLAEQAESLAFDPTHSGMATAYRLAARGVRAALGITVADTPGS